ncbi:MAG: hypothetical protein IJY62_02225 [Clostridia bacterium]|nr:hypothetical protein [Clostridia bacterium]
MELAEIFTDNMVFQANKPLRFWGRGSGNISVTLHDKTYKKECLEGKWVMELPSQSYGGPFDILLELQGEKTVLKNIAFGDVFLCAGQSNMQFTIAEEKGACTIMDNNRIRYFVSDRIEQYTGQKSADGWKICKNEEVGTWSALALHIAENYQKKKNVFVGIVGCFQGASVIRSWIPEKYLDESVYISMEERHIDSIKPKYSAWNSDSILYKKTFLPITPFSFKSVIWYQGESNTTVAESRVYTSLLSKLIFSWREALRDEELSFVIVEICDFDERNDEGWRSIQRCQKTVGKIVPNVIIVTSKDVCEHNHIHPQNKERLAEKIFCLL